MAPTAFSLEKEAEAAGGGEGGKESNCSLQLLERQLESQTIPREVDGITSGNSNKLCRGFKLYIMRGKKKKLIKRVVQHWDKLPGQAMEPASLKASQENKATDGLSSSRISSLASISVIL